MFAGLFKRNFCRFCIFVFCEHLPFLLGRGRLIQNVGYNVLFNLTASFQDISQGTIKILLKVLHIVIISYLIKKKIKKKNQVIYFQS